MDVLAMLPSFPVGSPSPSTMQQSKICQNLQVPRMYHEHLSISNPSYLSKKRMMDPEKKKHGNRQSINNLHHPSLSLSLHSNIYSGTASTAPQWPNEADQRSKAGAKESDDIRKGVTVDGHRGTKDQHKTWRKTREKKGRTPGEKNGTKPGNQPTNLRMVHSFRPWFNGNS